MIEKDKGTYLFLLHNSKAREISAGRFGKVLFPSGFYLYAGSAFGPGGLNARIGRHFRQDKKIRWHVDNLSITMNPVECWYHVSQTKRECQWNSRLEDIHDTYPLRGFGSSDCKCLSHLHYFSRKPSATALTSLLNAPLKIARG